MVTFLELPEDVKRIILEYLNAETLMRSMRLIDIILVHSIFEMLQSQSILEEYN